MVGEYRPWSCKKKKDEVPDCKATNDLLLKRKNKAFSNKVFKRSHLEDCLHIYFRVKSFRSPQWYDIISSRLQASELHI